MKLIITFTLLAAVYSLPTELPHSSELVYKLSEDEFEEYLEKWTEFEDLKLGDNSTEATTNGRSGCAFNVRGDINRSPPVFIHTWLNDYLAPYGNSGQIRLNSGDEFIVACPGNGRRIVHPNLASYNTASGTAKCVNGKLISGEGWLRGNSQFGQLRCNNHAYIEALETGETCYDNNVVIGVGYTVNKVFYPIYYSCFNKNRYEAVYVTHELTPASNTHQTGVSRPGWIPDKYFPGINVNSLYARNGHRAAIARAVGNNMVGNYVNNRDFLTRGHLVAKADQVFATGQRATFFFINAAPQWSSFNGGNWNTLEMRLRQRMSTRGYHATVYSGTFGVTQLRNSAGRYVDIYLDNTRGNRRLPVPLYFYKVVYDSNKRLGTAFIGINNPYYSLSEARNLQFCTDRCRNNAAFSWIGWSPDRMDRGYAFCCTVDDFRRYVDHLPNFQVDGLLT